MSEFVSETGNFGTQIAIHGNSRKFSETKNMLIYRILVGVADGTRTHDDRNHNPGLYQLSYSHHWYNTELLACPTGIEPVTPSLEGWCSIRLSYGHSTGHITTGRGGEIRTPDILVPNQARYQATLHPGKARLYADSGKTSNAG